jgi:transcriptional regulator with XRE-family HTH domain
MESLGGTLRALRAERGLSLARLAEQCACSRSFLSQLERDLTSVSIPVLTTICQVLGVTLSEFFAAVEPDGPARRPSDPLSSVIRAQEQVTVNPSKAAIKYRFLTRDLPERGFDIVIGEIPAGYLYPPAAHAGEEFGYILDGRLRLSIEGRDVDLEPGDSYHVVSTEPHGYQVLGETPARILWVQTVQDLKIREGVPAARPPGTGPS